MSATTEIAAELCERHMPRKDTDISVFGISNMVLQTLSCNVEMQPVYLYLCVDQIPIMDDNVTLNSKQLQDTSYIYQSIFFSGGGINFC